MNKLGFITSSGLGDILFDLTGFVTFCKLTKKQPVCQWCVESDNDIYPWGIGLFDKTLFNFPAYIEFVDELPADMDRIYSDNTSISTCMVKIHKYIKTIPLEEVITSYYSTLMEIIKPSNIIRYPANIEKAIGIHLRRSDKIKEMNEEIDLRHETLITEYDSILSELCICIENIAKISIDSVMYFYICSEDKEYVVAFKKQIFAICQKNNKIARFCEPIYDKKYKGVEAVTDMFYLSKCSCILQGTKYSTFSIIAAIIGKKPLYNFGHHSDKSLMHIWKPYLTLVNNGILLDHILNGASLINVSDGFSDMVIASKKTNLSMNDMIKKYIRR